MAGGSKKKRLLLDLNLSPRRSQTPPTPPSPTDTTATPTNGVGDQPIPSLSVVSGLDFNSDPPQSPIPGPRRLPKDKIPETHPDGFQCPICKSTGTEYWFSNNKKKTQPRNQCEKCITFWNEVGTTHAPYNTRSRARSDPVIADAAPQPPPITAVVRQPRSQRHSHQQPQPPTTAASDATVQPPPITAGVRRPRSQRRGKP